MNPKTILITGASSGIGAALARAHAKAYAKFGVTLLLWGRDESRLNETARECRALGAEAPGNLFFRALTHDRLQQRPEAIENYNKFLATSQGKFPDQEFQARQRVRILENELRKKR